MQAGFQLASGGRLDVLSDRATRRVIVEYRAAGADKDEAALTIPVTPSESRAIAYALTGASNEL